jgi:hypothetical protein
MKIDIKKKIIIFDSWTLGSIHIFRFAPLLVNSGIELCYCHVGSWGDDIGRKKEETINNLKFRDISYYGNNLKKILDHEKPDMVLFLSLDPMIHRAFNLYVKKYKILSAILYPGLWSVQSYSSLFISPKNFFSHFISLLRGFYRSLTYSIPTYIKSLKVNKSSISDWYDFFFEFLFKFFGFIKHVAPKSASIDYAFVFNDFDLDHAVKKFNLPKKNVFVIGVPDFIKFNLKSSQINSYSSKKINKNDNHIVYIGSGPRSTLMKFKSPLDYANYIIFTAKYLKENLNFKLACKLHYSRAKEYEILKKEKNIILINDNNFVKYLLKSRGALVEPSSAVLIPVALGVPVFFACFGKLKGIKFGPALLAYPNKKIINQLSDINHKTILKKKNKVNRKIISNIIGPQPSNLLPKRIVSHLITILNK